jgi:hypothetical protein
LKIKGKKTETAKFWPVFLDGWQEHWPKPALTDLVRDDGNEANASASTADASNEAGMENAVAGEADADKKEESASKTKGKKGKKGKKPLTVSVVRTTSSALAVSY